MLAGKVHLPQPSGRNKLATFDWTPIRWRNEILVARWMSDEVRAGVYGSDTWAGEVIPNPDPGCAFCVHEHMLTRHGIVHQENADFDQLIADKVYRFTYVFSPVPITGATGSAGSPIAID